MTVPTCPTGMPGLASTAGSLYALTAADPNLMYRWTPGDAAWTQVQAPAIEISGAFTSSDTGPLYVMGEGEGSASTQVWAYSYGADSWTQRPSLPIGVSGEGVCVTPDGTLWSIGGQLQDHDPAQAGDYTTAVYKLAPGAASWITGPSLPSGAALADGGACALSDGTIYWVGGVNSQGTHVATAYKLAPGAASWTALPDLPSYYTNYFLAANTDNVAFFVGFYFQAYVLTLSPGDSSWTTLDTDSTVNPVSACCLGTALYVSQFNSGEILEYVLPAAPSAPTLTSPQSGSYIDPSGGIAFSGIYNSTDLSAANGRALRIKPSGGSYQYLNVATNALQSTVVWNPVSIQPSASETMTVPESAFISGVTYGWSMADQESTASKQGPFASDFTVNAQTDPSISVTAPSGVANTSRPTVAWTTTPASGASQTSWHVRVFSSAQFGISGFDPGSSPATWDSGDNAGTATSVGIPVGLINGTTYRFYVQVSETGGEYSSWQYSSATVSYSAPAAVTITAAASTDSTTGLPLVEIDVQGHDNMLTAEQASFEPGVDWTAEPNWSVTQSNASALSGTYSMLCTRSNGTVGSGAASSAGYATVPGQTYTGLVSIGATASSAGKQYQLDIGDQSAVVTLGGAGTWTVAQVIFVAPYTQGFTAVLRVSDDPQTAPASGQEIYVDEAGIFPGQVDTWTAGGFVGIGEIVITRDDGRQVRGASVANPYPMPGTQHFVTVDAEMVPGVEHTFTATETVTLSPGVVVTSPESVSGPATIPASNGWWEFDPTDLTTAVHAQLTQYNPQVTEQATAHAVLGQATPNVIASVMGGVDGTATFETFNADTYQALTTLLLSQKTVFVSDPFGDNQGVTYVRFGPEPGGMSSGMGLKAKSANLQASTASAPHHTVRVTWVAQPRPPV